MKKIGFNSRIDQLLKLKKVCICIIQGIEIGYEEKPLYILKSLKNCALKIKLGNILNHQIDLNLCFDLQKEKHEDLLEKQYEIYRTAEDINCLLTKEIIFIKSI